MDKEVIDSFKAAISWLESKVLYGTTIGYELDDEPDTNEDCYHNLHTWEIEKATSATKAVAAWLRWDIKKNQIDWPQVDEVAFWLKRYEYVRKEYKNDFQDQLVNAMDYEMDNVSRQMKRYDKLRPQPERTPAAGVEGETEQEEATAKPDKHTVNKERAPEPDYPTLKTCFREGLGQWFDNSLMPLLKDKETQRPIKRKKVDAAGIALAIYESGYLKKKYTFTKWNKKFCSLAGYLPGKSYFKTNTKKKSLVYNRAKKNLGITTK